MRSAHRAGNKNVVGRGREGATILSWFRDVAIEEQSKQDELGDVHFGLGEQIEREMGPFPIHYWCTLFNANKGDLEPIPRKRLHLHRWKNVLNEEPSSYRITQSHKRYRRTVTATLNVSIFISKIITATNYHFMWCHYNHKPWLECVWTKGTILSSKPSGVTLVVPKPMCTRHAFQICCRVAVAVHWSSSSYKFFLRRKNDRATEQRRRRQHSCQ